MKTKTNQEQAMRVSTVAILWNMVLSVFKLFAGVYANSAAMVSDAVHSGSDVFSTVIVMIGVKISSKASDNEHPYGHERFESVAAIILAALLAATGAAIGWGGLQNILKGNYAHLAAPGFLALMAAVVSIIVKEAMYWYTHSTAKRIGSDALMADAWHHRSDAFSSIGSLIGIIGARMGLPVLDSVACLVICLFIIKAALGIFLDAVKKLTDTACDDLLTSKIQETILAQKGVIGIDLLNTRLFGSKVYVDVEIRADGNITLHESHEVAHRVHDEIEKRFPDVKHCMVHVNPQ